MKKIAIIILILGIFEAKCQRYIARYEDGKGRVSEWGYANLVFCDKKVFVHYENDCLSRVFSYPVINKYTQYYIMTRDSRSSKTDFWIISQRKYTIVRIWSNQKTGSFGRITYFRVNR